MTINPNETPNPETPAEAPVTPEAPAELLAGKYKSQDDLVAGYKALEARLGAEPTPPVTPPTETPPAETTPPVEAPADAEVQDVLGKAGIDFTALSTEFETSGELSEATIADLEAKGFPKAVVDQYIAGRQATGEAVVADLYNHTGGQENFDALLAWGGENMSPDEVSAFNAALDSSNMADTKLAIDGVRARMTTAGAWGEPTLVTPSNQNPGTPSTGFTSQADMSEAINKRDGRGRQLYGNDPQYTKQVEARMATRTF